MSVPVAPSQPEYEPPDSHGQAALLLVESLIHGLIGRRVLSVQEAVDIVEIALDAQVAMAEIGGAVAPQLLETILHSMEIDLPRP